MTRMLLIGLFLLAATAAFTVLAIIGNLAGGPHYTVSVLHHVIATMSALAIFAAGLALALIFTLGLATAMIGMLHRRHRHRTPRHAAHVGPGPMR
ncbi:hypothetical protein [Streptomyces nodosus]|nr:hypothetical protein [Streptomyces nodosus]MBB4790346.1 hypothetical protein [Streptomyces nodosus]